MPENKNIDIDVDPEDIAEGKAFVDFGGDRSSIYIKPKPALMEPTVPPGNYKVGFNHYTDEAFLSKYSPSYEDYIDIDDEVMEAIRQDIFKFWSSDTEKRFRNIGLKYRRGILLYGPPGCGKTSLINQLTQEVVKTYNGLAVYHGKNLNLEINYLAQMRELDPNQKILFVVEDVDTFFDHRENSGSDLLGFLDGPSQVDNVLTIMTTNFYHSLPSRLVNRPSRVSRAFELKNPSDQARREYIEVSVENITDKLTKREIRALRPQEFVENIYKHTEGMTMDQIKNVVLSAYCMEISIEDAVKIARSQ